MIVSYNWLQKYFDKPLPSAKDIAELLTLRAFEVESVEEVAGDFILDVDVLPNRASDCLSHRGIAKEISVLLNLDLKIEKRELGVFEKGRELSVLNHNKDICKRYVGRRMENLKIGPSPEWLSKSLETIGQKSINNVVDATNYVMFDTGQPLHAFDADKVDGGIVVRNAVSGEKITTLDGKEVELDESILVIADQSAPLAIAGIKGGKRAEVDENTKNIILEAANFTQVPVRKTSRKLHILTDSSKRFENQIPPELASIAMEEVTALVAEIAETDGTKIGDMVDIHEGVSNLHKVTVTVEQVNKLLGSDIKESEVQNIFDRFGFKYEISSGKFTVTIPYERLDLRIKEDIIEEIGRIYGYENIAEDMPQKNQIASINKTFYYANKIRNILIKSEFSEVYTYAFVDKGSVEIENPIASDKAFLRNDLLSGVIRSANFNTKYIDLFGADSIKIFEIGKVFEKDTEHLNLCVAIKNTNKASGDTVKEIESVISTITDNVTIEVNIQNITGVTLFEINLGSLIEKLPEPSSYEDVLETYIKDVKFKILSSYPFITRDIAVFVPVGVEEYDVSDVIKRNAGELLVREPRLFDKFEKKNKETGEIEKVSYAFKTVFQSQEKTLTDEEVNVIINKITETLNNKAGWEVR